MSKCAQCGFENPDINKFCQNCGVALVKLSPAPSVSVEVSRSDTLTDLVEELPAPTDILSAQKEEAWLGVLSKWMGAPTDIPSVRKDEVSQPADFPSVREDEVLQPADFPSAREDEVLQPADFPSAREDEVLQPADFPSAREDEVLQPADNNVDDSIPTMPLSVPQHTKAAVRLTGLKHAGLTDVGNNRDRNEDAFATCSQVMIVESSNDGIEQTSRGLFVLCDGMGGHDGGEVASALAIARIQEGFQQFWAKTLPGENKLREIINVANQAIYDLNELELRRDSGRMGTTLVLLALHNSEIAIAHVGDSRIYQITAGKIEQVTRDHEVFNRLIDQGVDAEAASARPDARQLTQALGPNANHQINPSIQYFELSEPTLFLLCSDGLCDNDVVEQNWQSFLLPLLSPEADLREGVKAAIDLGNSLNGHDNITAILVNCQVAIDESN